MRTKWVNFGYMDAAYAGEKYKGHAQEVMDRLSIEFYDSTPDSMGDCWRFLVAADTPWPPWKDDPPLELVFDDKGIHVGWKPKEDTHE